MESEVCVAIKKSFEKQRRLDEEFPLRRVTIHKGCCKSCPSNQDRIRGIEDPESKEIKSFPKEFIVSEFLFVCYLRPDKLCKGLCDYMEIDQEYINSLQNDQRKNSR